MSPEIKEKKDILNKLEDYLEKEKSSLIETIKKIQIKLSSFYQFINGKKDIELLNDPESKNKIFQNIIKDTNTLEDSINLIINNLYKEIETLKKEL
ncbi:MAG: hypothetical protein GF329_15990 [Candidatus Lokiarchaeota archaeon]|nr:hypothetical protein [Candidatus Lokiarchaeota archaeon]